MKQHLTLLFVTLTLFSLPAGRNKLLAQSTFQEIIFMNDSLCIPSHITTLPDGGALISGNIFTLPGVFEDEREGLLWKVNAEGQIVWSRRIKRPVSCHDAWLEDIEITADGGCIVLMNARINNAFYDQTAPEIIRMDNSGNIIWIKKATGNCKLIFKDIRKVAGGYLISGYSGSSQTFPLIKIDTDGNIIWGKIFRGLIGRIEGMYELPNGEMIIPGGIFHRSILRLDSAGNVLQQFYFGDTTTTGIQSVTLTYCKPMGDSLLFIGHDFGSGSIIFLKTDMNGHPGTSQGLKVDGYSLLLSDIDEYPNNDFLLTCYNTPDLFNRPFLINITSDLSINWTRTFGSPGSSVLLSESAATDSYGTTWISATWTEGEDAGVYLARTDAGGDIPGPCCPRPFEVEWFNMPVYPITKSFLLDTIPVFIDGTLITSPGQFIIRPFCEIKHSISLSETDICPASCINVTLSHPDPVSQYHWAFPGGTPDTSSLLNPSNICYFTLGEHQIYLSQDGCLVDSTTLTISKIPDQFPNAFTPDNDGVNDAFRPVLYCPVEDFHMQVFNRWGRQVFETTDPVTGWDGLINGTPAPVDVYIYRMQYFTYDGIKKEAVLMRNEDQEVTLLR